MRAQSERMKRIREQLFAARRAITAGELNEAERAYRSILAIEPTDEAALEGILDIERLRRIETDGVSSTDWQEQYAAGADESIDLPPMLSSDIFETLSTDDTEPPSIPAEGHPDVLDTPDVEPSPFVQSKQDVGQDIQGVATVAGDAEGEPQNPLEDPYLMPQADFSNSETRVGQVRQASRPQQQRASKPSPVFSDDHKRTLSRHAQVSAPQAATIDGHRQPSTRTWKIPMLISTPVYNLPQSLSSWGLRGSITASLSALERSPDHPIALSLKASSERHLQDMPQRRVNQLGLRPRLQLSQNEG